MINRDPEVTIGADKSWGSAYEWWELGLRESCLKPKCIYAVRWSILRRMYAELMSVCDDKPQNSASKG